MRALDGREAVIHPAHALEQTRVGGERVGGRAAIGGIGPRRHRLRRQDDDCGHETQAPGRSPRGARRGEGDGRLARPGRCGDDPRVVVDERRRVVGDVDRPDEPIPASGQRLDVGKGPRAIADGRAHLPHGHRQTALEIDVGALGPDRGAQLVARDQLAGPEQQRAQQAKRLLLQRHGHTVPAQFAGRQVGLEGAESHAADAAEHR
jgi:hypothetical protein